MPPTAGDGDGIAWYGDTAYGTGELREAIGQAGHQAVIKPKSVQPAVPGGFTCDDFAVDEENGTVTCPAGVTRTIPPGPPCRLRRRLPRLPAALAVHHLQVRAGPQPDPA